VTSQTVVLREYTLPVTGLKRRAQGVRIAHVSDFHFRQWNPVLEQAQHLLRSLDYDLLVATGDYSTLPCRWAHAAEMCKRFFEPINPPRGTFAVLGNHDDRILADQPDMPFTWLRNEHVRINVNGSCLVLAGVEQCVDHRGDIDAALTGAPESAPTVLLAHYPSSVYKTPSDRVCLVLAGHTHGGQIRLPFLGCIWANDRIRPSKAHGMHKLHGTMLHVTAGIGVSSPLRFRYRCPPEVSLITLRCACDNRLPTEDQAKPSSRNLHPVSGLAAQV